MRSPAAQNPPSIQEMFSAVAHRYDLANTVLSFGTHSLWKRKLIHESGLKVGDSILDCATGTGDLAFLFEKKLRKIQYGTVVEGQIVGSDFCEPMLEKAREKGLKKKSAVKFQWADATQLPYDDGQFDVVSISFGIRNTRDTALTLTELGRVLKRGGSLLILEFGQPLVPGFSKLYDFYSSSLIPRIGGWLSGQRDAYRYLQTSSSQYPSGNGFLNIGKAVERFTEMKATPLCGGVVWLYCFR